MTHKVVLTTLPFPMGYCCPQKGNTEGKAEETVQEDTDGGASSFRRELLHYPGHGREANPRCRYICSGRAVVDKREKGKVGLNGS